MNLQQHQLISISQLSRNDIENLIAEANKLREGSSETRALKPFIAALLFFEASTRTQSGFQAATYKLGGQSIIINKAKFQSSMTKEESIEDTIQTLVAYADILCIREADEQIFSKFSTSKPLLNCGNGYDEHPSQTLIDLMSIKNSLGRLDNIKITIIGDARHMRPAHSLMLAFAQFKNITIRIITPRTLRIPKKYNEPYLAAGNKLQETESWNTKDQDIIYMTGFAPKTPRKYFPATIRNKYQLNLKKAANLSDNAIILCPMPRIDEITKDVDNLPQARYFQQNENGLYMRMAIISYLLRRV